MRNLKDAYKRAKESNKKTDATPSFPAYFTQIDKILGCRDAMNLPEKTEVGANSDVNKSNVLKQVPEKVLVKGDAANLKHIFHNDKSCPRIFDTDFCPLNV